MGAQYITEQQMDDLLAAIDRKRAARAETLPDEAACLNAAFQAWERLRELGWNDIIYCPKDGTVFDSISAGSTGIHDCHYQGEWPSGSWWVHDGGDLWPAHPILFRRKPATGQKGGDDE